MKISMMTLVADDRGQDLIEYALLAGFVSLVVVATVTNLGSSVNTIYTGCQHPSWPDSDTVAELSRPSSIRNSPENPDTLRVPIVSRQNRHCLRSPEASYGIDEHRPPALVACRRKLGESLLCALHEQPHQPLLGVHPAVPCPRYRTRSSCEGGG